MVLVPSSEIYQYKYICELGAEIIINRFYKL